LGLVLGATMTGSADREEERRREGKRGGEKRE
jgi:hypothetical protein